MGRGPQQDGGRALRDWSVSRGMPSPATPRGCKRQGSVLPSRVQREHGCAYTWILHICGRVRFCCLLQIQSCKKISSCCSKPACLCCFVTAAVGNHHHVPRSSFKHRVCPWSQALWGGLQASSLRGEMLAAQVTVSRREPPENQSLSR